MHKGSRQLFQCFQRDLTHCKIQFTHLRKWQQDIKTSLLFIFLFFVSGAQASSNLDVNQYPANNNSTLEHSPTTANEQNPKPLNLDILASSDSFSILLDMLVLNTESDNLQFFDIKKMPASAWKALPKNFHFSPLKQYWFKLEIGYQDLERQWLISPGLWHSAMLYQSLPSGTSRNQQQILTKNLSVFQPLSHRDFPHRNPFYKLKTSKEPYTIWLQLKGYRFGRDYSAQQPILAEQNALLEKQKSAQYTQGGYLGFALGLAGFHLVLFLWSRERTYLWLVAAATISSIFFHAYNGLGLTVFWPNWPAWDEYSPVFLGSAAIAIYLLFGSSYLHLRQYFPKIEKFLQLAAFLLIISSFAVFYKEANLLWLQALTQAVASTVILIAAILLSRQGMRHARYFVAGNILILIALVTWAMMETGIIMEAWLPFKMGTITQFASATQGILLALGMVGRMQLMRQEILRQELVKEKLISNQARQTRRMIEAQNEALSLKNESLKEIDELKDEFLAKTSHELNTPLNGIIGLSEVLLDDGFKLSEKEKKEYLEIIVARSEHLRDLVADLLQFAQTRKNAISLRKVEVDLVLQTQQLIRSFEPSANQKGLALKLETEFLAEELNEQADNNEQPRLLVKADLKRIRQVLAILIDNAIKYTDSGKIEVVLAKNDKFATVTVSDSGIGIEANQLDGIFDAFKQVHDNEKPRGGAGLGLSICKHLVELHQGEILVHSKPGIGSEFSIKLPR